MCVCVCVFVSACAFGKAKETKSAIDEEIEAKAETHDTQYDFLRLPRKKIS